MKLSVSMPTRMWPFWTTTSNAPVCRRDQRAFNVQYRCCVTRRWRTTMPGRGRSGLGPKTPKVGTHDWRWCGGCFAVRYGTLDPARGSEANKRRPAVLVSNDRANGAAAQARSWRRDSRTNNEQHRQNLSISGVAIGENKRPQVDSKPKLSKSDLLRHSGSYDASARSPR